MIDFEGYYLVPPDQVAYIETRRGGGDAQYGLFLGLSSGKELGVWYRTEEARKAAYQDVANIKEDIVQRLCTKPYFGGAFTVLKPIAWAMQQDDTYPYYFGACSLTCTAPAMTQDTEMEELV